MPPETNVTAPYRELVEANLSQQEAIDRLTVRLDAREAALTNARQQLGVERTARKIQSLQAEQDKSEWEREKGALLTKLHKQKELALTAESALARLTAQVKTGNSSAALYARVKTMEADTVRLRNSMKGLELAKQQAEGSAQAANVMVSDILGENTQMQLKIQQLEDDKAALAAAAAAPSSSSSSSHKTGHGGNTGIIHRAMHRQEEEEEKQGGGLEEEEQGSGSGSGNGKEEGKQQLSRQQLLAKLKAVESAAAEATAALSRKEVSVEALQTELAGLYQEYNSLKELASDLQQNVQQLRSESDRARACARELQVTNAVMAEDVRRSARAVEVATGRLKIQESACSSLQGEVERLTSVVETKDRQRQEMKASVQNYLLNA
mmetsp:Transcript_11807/g.22481  ORF Transcript_11807/g.22481 Transcript_11807/m.22481 type:complete len:380 (+) Transcript_11807:512-1651(+)